MRICHLRLFDANSRTVKLDYSRRRGLRSEGRVMAPMLAVGSRVWCRSGEHDARSSRRANSSRKASKARAPKRGESPIRRAVVVSDVAETRAIAATAPTEDAFSLGCPHFDTCSGCSSSTNLDDFPELRRAREYFAKSHGVDAFECATGDVTGWRIRARLAARMVPDDTNGGQKLALGLFARGSHDLVEIPHCVVQHPRLNDAAALIAEACSRAGIRAYDETTGEGELRYVQLTAVGRDGCRADLDPDAAVQVALVWNAPAPTAESGPMSAPRAIALALKLWNSNSADSPGDIEPPNGMRVHSVWVNWNDAAGNTITSPHWTHLKGDRFAWSGHGDAEVALTPASFAQANAGAFDAALARIRGLVFKDAAVSELYAGAGPIGLSIAATMTQGEDEDGGSVRCVEIVGAAAETFEASRSRLPESVQKRVSMVISRAEDVCRDAVRDADVMIVDPPRQGLDPRTVAALTGGTAALTKADGGDEGVDEAASSAAAAAGREEKKPVVKEEKKPMTRAAKRRARKKKKAKAKNASQAAVKAEAAPEKKEEAKPTQPTVKFPAPPARLSRLIYLSCGFSAFQRDCDALIESGQWRLTHCEGFNFFPGSDHIETLAVFDREETGSALWEE